MTLEHAIEILDVDGVKELIKQKAHLDQENADGVLPIHLAAYQSGPKALEILEVLLQAGAQLQDDYINRSSPLWTATKLGRMATVNFLLEKKADCNQPYMDGEVEITTPFFEAISSGNGPLVEILLRAKAIIVDKTYLEAAVDSGSVQVVSALLEEKVNPGLLDAAAVKGNAEIVKVLFEARAVLHDRGILGSMDKDVSGELVKLLIQAKADLEAKDIYRQQTIFMRACASGNAEAARLLLEVKANMGAVDQWGNTALSLAMSGAGRKLPAILQVFPTHLRPTEDAFYLELITKIKSWKSYMVSIIEIEDIISQVEGLLAAKASINYAPVGQPSVLECAKQEDVHQRILDVLEEALKRKKKLLLLAALYQERARTQDTVEAFSRPRLKEAKKSQIYDSLYTAINANPLDVSVIRSLLDSRAETNSLIFAATPLTCIARRAGGGPITQLLLDEKADWRVADATGSTPLSVAVNFGRVEVAKVLLEEKANPDGRLKFGSLYIAMQNKDLNMLRTLLLFKAYIEQPGLDSISPLFYAAKKNLPEVVKILAEAKAAITARDESGNTALHIAVLASNEKNCNPLLFSQLVAAKVDTCAINHRGETALQMALKWEKPLPIVFALVAARASPAYASPGGESALGFARRKMHQRYINVLEEVSNPMPTKSLKAPPLQRQGAPDEKSDRPISTMRGRKNELAIAQSRSSIWEPQVLRLVFRMADLSKLTQRPVERDSEMTAGPSLTG